MAQADGPPRQTNRWKAIFSLVAIAAVVGVWLYASRRSAEAAAETPSERIAGELPGFQSDLFYLPDGALGGFVEIPGGPFLMGSDPAFDPGAFENEFWRAGGGQGVVDLPTFYMARTEVTRAQYAAFVQATQRAVLDSLAVRGAPDHPVVGVSWPDAVAYARWLTGALRESSATPEALRGLLESGWRVTLPTEAEWEKAARGTDGRIFPWGNDQRRDAGNFLNAGTAPVGSFRCSDCAYGLADMAGNVWELTASPYQPPPYDPSDDRADLQSDALWVMRGGGFSDNPQLVRAAVRGGADPGARRPFIGFRVALTPPSE